MAARPGMIVEERTPTASPAPVGMRSRDADPWDRPLVRVVGLLGVAAITELVLMRTFYRVGIFIPRRGWFPQLYRVLTAVGSFALDLASVLVLVALALFAARGLRKSRGAAAWSLLVFVGVSVVLAVTHERSIGPTSRLLFAFAVIAVSAPFLRSGARRTERVAVATVVGVCLLSSSAALVGDGGGAPGSGSSAAVIAQLAAEALSVISAFALLVAWVRWDRVRLGAIAAGVLAAAGLLVSWAANGSITGILALWTVGLRLYLPVWVYAIAAGAFAATVVTCRRSAPWRTVGLVLLFAGGIGLGSTYAASLVLAGVVLVTDAAGVGGFPTYSPSSGISSRRLAMNVASASCTAGSSPGSS